MNLFTKKRIERLFLLLSNSIVSILCRTYLTREHARFINNTIAFATIFAVTEIVPFLLPFRSAVGRVHRYGHGFPFRCPLWISLLAVQRESQIVYTKSREKPTEIFTDF